MIRSVAAMVVALIIWPGVSLASAAAVPANSAVPQSKPSVLSMPQFRRYEVSDGLTGSAVNALAQDAQGVMWFGGAGGLASYDGTDFKQYVHSAADPDSIATRDVTQVVPGLHGEVWVSGDSGLDQLDPGTSRFRHWRHDPENPQSLTSDAVYSIAQDRKGTMWVGTDSGLDRLDPRSGQVQHIVYSKAIASADAAALDQTVNAMLATKDNELWFGTMSGKLFKRLADGSIRRVPVLAPSDQLNQIWRIEGQGSDIRIATRLGLYIVGADGVARPAIDPAKLKPGYVFASARDDSGRLWVATVHGLVMIDAAGMLRTFRNQSQLRGGLPGDWIWRVLKDREGGMWFSFHEAGVAYLPPEWDRFSRFTHVPDDPDSLHDTLATALAAGAGTTLWVGGRGQIDKLDPATGQVQHVIKDLAADVISMAVDRDALWFTVRGVLQVHRHGKTQNIDPDHRVIKAPKLLVVDPAGNVYVSAAAYGIVRVDAKTLQTTPVAMPPDAANIDLGVSGMGYENGALWFANHQGLMRWDAALGRMAFAPGVPRGEVAAFSLDHSGLWLARKDTLEHYVHAGSGFKRDRVLGIKNGWNGASVYGFVADSRKRLWIFSSNGLSRLDPATGTFRSFGPQDGLLTAEFIESPVALGDHAFFAPSQDGVIGFDPQSRPLATVPPTVQIHAVEVRGERGLRQVSLNDHRVKLHWTEHDILLQARAHSYISPASNRYQFNIAGLDNNWVDRGSSGDREIFSLSPGSYTVQVRAANAYGQWGSLQQPLIIDVQAPPWARWWAWLTYGLLLASAVWLLARAWRQRLARRHQMQLSEQQRVLAEQASAAKTEFLATLSHEIRTPMTGVIGMAELLLTTPLAPRQLDYAQSVQRSGKMLLKLLNDALDLARIEAGRLELEPAPFDAHQLLTDVAQMVAGQAQAKSIDFVLDIAPDLPPWLVGDAVRIKQILINLAHNAVKFTERGSVTLGGQAMAEGVLFSVSDTGPGIPEASQARLFQRFEQMDGAQRQAGSGLGLAICRELVTMMGGSVELQSRVAHGSTFRVRLPLAAPVIDEAAAPAVPASGIVNATGRYRVLLVEDDVTVAAVIRGLLEQHGHQVSHVANGLGALAELSHGVFDVLLLDLDLPGVDGFQIARLVRQREVAGEHLPIVAITARAGGQEETQTRAVGMDGFLRKPLTGEQLITAIGAVAVPTLDEMDV